MNKLTCWTSLLTILIVISICYFQTSDAHYCACLTRHPQTHFCDSDFSALVSVNKLLQPNDNEVAYNVELRQIFKATQSTQIALTGKEKLLWSPSMDSMCGRFDLILGESYVVNGRILDSKLYISRCDFVQPWSMLTPLQRKGFQQFYQRGCACPISDTKRHHEGGVQSAGEKSCLWESTSGSRDCHKRHGICMPTSAGCSWARSLASEKCINERQHLRAQSLPNREYCRKISEIFPISHCI